MELRYYNIAEMFMMADRISHISWNRHIIRSQLTSLEDFSDEFEVLKFFMLNLFWSVPACKSLRERNDLTQSRLYVRNTVRSLTRCTRALSIQENLEFVADALREPNRKNDFS
jgi:hypothetical protein